MLLQEFGPTSIIEVWDQEKRMIFAVEHDGELRIGDGYSPRDAADAFFERLRERLPARA